jgi:hypothetical protein
MHTCTHIYIHTHTHTGASLEPPRSFNLQFEAFYGDRYARMHSYIHMYVCKTNTYHSRKMACTMKPFCYMCICVCVCVYVYVCLYVCVYICIYTYIHTYLHTHTIDRGKTRKIDTYVNFPLELDLKPFCHREAPKESVNDSVYDLFGAVVHSGSLNSGHYVAYVSDLGAGPNRVWRYFSDAQVKVCIHVEYICMYAY